MYRVVVFILFAFASATRGLPPDVRHLQKDSVDAVEIPDLLSKRGESQPPDVPPNGPAISSGMLSVKCESPNCCRTIGLDPDIPQVSLRYMNDLQ
jgi:hypothetical protein